MGGCRRPRDPGCARRSKKKVCLFASLVLPLPEAANLKSCPGWGAGDPAPRGSPSFPAVPLLLRQAWEGGQGGQALCPALRRAPPTGAGRGAARETPGWGGRLSAPAAPPVPRGLARPPSIWPGFPLRAYCAHAGGLLCAREGTHCAHAGDPLRAGGVPEPRAPSGQDPPFPALRPCSRGRAPRVTSGCVLANCVSATGSGVPPW